MRNEFFLKIKSGKIKEFRFSEPFKKIVINENQTLITDVLNQKEESVNNKKHIGVLIENKNSLNIYSDRFSSIPLFYLIKDEEIVISNIFNNVFTNDENFKIDNVGFWESFLFETPLLDRTIFNEIKVIQAGCYLEIKNNKANQKRFYNYDFDIKKHNNLLEETYQVLSDNLYNVIKKDQNILFPLSGGIDSRLLFGFLKRNLDFNKLKTITYGFDKESYENKYAIKILRATNSNIEQHDFHKLDDKSYINYIDALNNITGGFIGTQNSHLFNYLNNFDNKDSYTCISGMLADAIFGFSSFNNEDELISDTKKYNIAKNFHEKGLISQHVFSEMKKDLQVLYKDWNENIGVKSFSEYIYIRERNTKFHMQMINLFRSIIDVNVPLLDYEIIDFFMSITPDKKQYKDIIFKLLDKYFEEFKNISYVSSVFGFSTGKGKGMSKFSYYRYLFISFLNKVLLKKMKIPYEFNNPFNTEKQDYYFLKDHFKLYQNKVDYLFEIDLIDKNQKKLLKSFVDGKRGYQLITNVDLIKDSRGKALSVR